MKKIIIFIVLINLFCCSGCDRTGCIPADSMGDNHSVTIESNPSRDNFKSDDGVDGKTVNNYHQVSRWIDTGIETNGEPLLIEAQGRWSAWLGGDNDEEYKKQDLGDERICTPIEGHDRENGHYWLVGYNQPKDDIKEYTREEYANWEAKQQLFKLHKLWEKSTDNAEKERLEKLLKKNKYYSIIAQKKKLQEEMAEAKKNKRQDKYYEKAEELEEINKQLNANADNLAEQMAIARHKYDLEDRLKKADGEDEKDRLRKQLVNVTNSQYGLPCWFVNGYGAYLLLRQPGAPDPNSTIEEMRNPSNPTAHLFYPVDKSTGYGLFDSSKQKFYQNNVALDAIPAGSKIYAKIYDTYYNDNIGEYTLNIKSGYKVEPSFRLFDTCASAIVNLLRYNTKKLFTQITQNDSYRKFIYAMIMLYICFTGFSYLIGIAQVKIGDIMMRLIKIVIIAQFLSPDAWSFFSKNILNLYLDGVSEVIGIALSSFNYTTYDPQFPFQALDLFFLKLFSTDVWIKIGSMFAIDILALVWVLFLILIIGFFLWVLLFAFMIYLTSMTVISIVIVCMPLLFVAMFFQIFKSILEGWFSILLSYSLQAVMIFCLVSMMMNLMIQEMYKNLGFPACKNLIANIGVIGKSTVFAKPEAFTPGQDYLTFNWYPFALLLGVGAEIAIEAAEEGTGATERGGAKAFVSWILGSSIESKKIVTIYPDKAVIKVPPFYDYEEERYIHLPFLSLTEDADRIEEILERGRILDLGGTCITLLICFTLFVLRNTILEVAQYLSGASLLSGLANQGLLHQGLGQMIDSQLSKVQDKIATARLGKLPSLDMIDRYTSMVTGGKSVHSVTNRKINAHNRFTTLNRMRDKTGTLLQKTHSIAQMPKQIGKSLVTLDPGSLKSYASQFKPSNLKETFGDNIDYADKSMRKGIAEKHMSNLRDQHIKSGLIFDPDHLPEGYELNKDFEEEDKLYEMQKLEEQQATERAELEETERLIQQLEDDENLDDLNQSDNSNNSDNQSEVTESEKPLVDRNIDPFEQLKHDQNLFTVETIQENIGNSNPDIGATDLKTLQEAAKERKRIAAEHRKRIAEEHRKRIAEEEARQRTHNDYFDRNEDSSDDDGDGDGE